MSSTFPTGPETYEVSRVGLTIGDAVTTTIAPVETPATRPPDLVAADDDDRPTRDLSVDLLRAMAIAAVALGHWLVVVPSYADGRFDGVNALQHVPVMRPLTWIFQVMPLFFVVGGVANAASWSGARARGASVGGWLRGRLDRLVRPSALLFGVVVGSVVVAHAAGVDRAVIDPIAWLVVVPVWFLAVYVLVVAMAPTGWSLHERYGVRVPLALGGAAAAVDAVRLAGGPEPVSYLNFLLVFGSCQQVGFAWFDGRLRRDRRLGPVLAVGGLLALVLSTSVGPYPVSMVGYPGPEIDNNAPPTVALIALGLAQTGLALMVRPSLHALLRRRSVQAFAMVMNGYAMTILLWHFAALVIAGLVLLPLGVVPDPPAGSGAWWLVRFVSAAVLAVLLVPMVGLAGRVERRRGTVSEAAGWAPLLAVPVLAVAFALITLNGLCGSGPLGIPVVEVCLFVAGVALVLGGPVGRGDAGGPRSVLQQVGCATEVAGDDQVEGSGRLVDDADGAVHGRRG